jgi:hypothetical protein
MCRREAQAQQEPHAQQADVVTRVALHHHKIDQTFI